MGPGPSHDFCLWKNPNLTLSPTLGFLRASQLHLAHVLCLCQVGAPFLLLLPLWHWAEPVGAGEA